MNFLLISSSHDFKVCQKSTSFDINETWYNVRGQRNIHDYMTFKVTRGQGQGEEMTSVPYRDYFIKFNTVMQHTTQMATERKIEIIKSKMTGCCHHRLHESASPMLTVTHHSNGRFCDFLLFSARLLRSDPSTDRHAKWLKQCSFRQVCAFWSKNQNFLYHLNLSPRKQSKFGQFWSELRKFLLDFALSLAV